MTPSSWRTFAALSLHLEVAERPAEQRHFSLTLTRGRESPDTRSPHVPTERPTPLLFQIRRIPATRLPRPNRGAMTSRRETSHQSLARARRPSLCPTTGHLVFCA